MLYAVCTVMCSVPIFRSGVCTERCAACSVDLQRHAGVTVCGIQWIDPTVAVVISSNPHLVSQLESDGPPAEGNILSEPQVHLAAEIKHQGLNTDTRTCMHDQLLKTDLTRPKIKEKPNKEHSPEETSDLHGAQ